MTGTIIKPMDFTQPLKWHGGKAYLAAKYWSIVDEAKLEFQHVVEPYFGGGAFTLPQPNNSEGAKQNDQRF